MHRRFISVERLQAIAADAIRGGYGTLETWPDNPADPLAGRGRRVVRLAGSSCSDPMWFELHARYSARHGKRVKPMTVYGSARCRKCEACLRARSFMWRQKAVAEFAHWPVTVFGTITMAPEAHYMIDARIEAGLRNEADTQWVRHPVPLRMLSYEELFRLRVRVFGEELQRYIKRLRKGDAVRRRPKVRYLLVAEAHDGALTSLEMRGRVHFHMLLHEVERGSLFLGSSNEAMASGEDGDFISRKYKSRDGWRAGLFIKDDAFVRKQWSFGHTKFQVAENEKAASYLCKYLTKTASNRIRCSQFYGDPSKIDHLLSPLAGEVARRGTEEKSGPPKD